MVRQPVSEITPESWDATSTSTSAARSSSRRAPSRPAGGARQDRLLADVAALSRPNYLPHNVSKAGLVMLTQTLARVLAPEIAVNAVAPGPVLLPEDWDQDTRARFAQSTPLARLGHPDDVVAAVRFLLEGTDFVTGTTVVVDGGRLIR
jgi:pteridine reductase